MKTKVIVLAKCFAISSLLMGTFSALAQQPTIILPTVASAPNGIAPNGIGVTPTELLFSEPFCLSVNQPRGIYSVTALAAGAPGTLNGTVTKTIPIPENGCAENYFAISPGLGGFPANSVYATNPTSPSGTTDAVLKDGLGFITSIPDSIAGHAGIAFDTVGTFANALIVTTPNGVFGFDSAGNQLFTYPAPVLLNFFESATVAPLSNTACPGCLYITSDIPNGPGGAIFTVAPGTASGTKPTFVTLVPGSEPEGIQFITPQACTLAGTNLAYFVSAYGSGSQEDHFPSTSGALLGYSPAQLAPFVGQALIPLETGVGILAFNPTSNTFTTFSTPVPIPTPKAGPATYQLEGSSLVACAPSSSKGRMTGGGSFFTPDGTRVTHGFELHCSVPSHPNNLEVNWGGGNNFHLEALTSVSCFLDPSISAGQPSADFNTMIGTGTGTLNGAPATISFEFTDAGEPGTNDKASVVIQSGTTTFTVPLTVLDNGNQQAHK